MICNTCKHPMSEHNGPSGECRHDYEPYASTRKEQCLCNQGKKMKEAEGIVLD